MKRFLQIASLCSLVLVFAFSAFGAGKPIKVGFPMILSGGGPCSASLLP